MKIKQRFFFILDAIDQASQLVEPEEIIKLDIDDKQNSFFRDIGATQLDSIFSLLEKKRVIKVIKKAEPLHAYTAIKSGLLKSRDVFCFFFLKDINFNSYFDEIKRVIIPNQVEVENNDSVIFELSYDDFSGQISIDDLQSRIRYYLKKLQDNSVNRVIFEFLFNNLNKKFDIKELGKIVKEKINKTLVPDLNQVAFELGFNKNLKKVFFSTSKNSAKLRTKITGKELAQTNVDLVSILKEMRLKSEDI